MVVVTDQGTVWAWGCNAAGQLGAGCSSTSPTGMLVSPSWVAAPLEVVGAAAAAGMGGPITTACGEEHTALLCRSGEVWAAGSNAAGACGLPVVQLAASSWAQVPLPAGQAAAALSCGRRNTAVVTRSRRLLTCGTSDAGQAGTGRAGGSCYLLSDIGPSAAWHGMARLNRGGQGGGGEAAAGVVGAACGSGSLYALTSSGEVFSCGQGSQGELGLGGNSKTVCTPSRLPWAHGAAAMAASCGGRFAAVVDGHGRLFSFGAGQP